LDLGKEEPEQVIRKLINEEPLLIFDLMDTVVLDPFFRVFPTFF